MPPMNMEIIPPGSRRNANSADDSNDLAAQRQNLRRMEKKKTQPYWTVTGVPKLPSGTTSVGG
jgi:hypothetical protein